MRSGKLRKAIRTRERSEDENGMRFAVEIPRSAFYGRFLEWGTSKFAAKPFMRPAADAKAEEAVTKMRDSLQVAISLELARTRR